MGVVKHWTRDYVDFYKIFVVFVLVFKNYKKYWERVGNSVYGGMATPRQKGVVGVRWGSKVVVSPLKRGLKYPSWDNRGIG